ncbi:unnamed protein product, partial [Didymodactylos carnosus]
TPEAEFSDIQRNRNSWQKLILDGEKYVVRDDLVFRQNRHLQPSNTSTHNIQTTTDMCMNQIQLDTSSTDCVVETSKLQIDYVLQLCNQYAESVLQYPISGSETHKKSINDDEDSHTVIKKTRSIGINTESEKFHSSSGHLRIVKECSSDDPLEKQWRNTFETGYSCLSQLQLTELGGKKDRLIEQNSNIHSSVQFQLQTIDCMYEKNRSEYYAKQIREIQVENEKLTCEDHNKECRSRKTKLNELLNVREKMCSSIYAFSNQLPNFHSLNETFYNECIDEEIKLKTDEEKQATGQQMYDEKLNRLKKEITDLETRKVATDLEFKDIQRRFFSTNLNSKNCRAMNDIIEKLLIDYACSRKKHQLLNSILMQLKLKCITKEKLINDDYYLDEENVAKTIEMKRQKFDELKNVLTKQMSRLSSLNSLVIYKRLLRELSRLSNNNSYKSSPIYPKLVDEFRRHKPLAAKYCKETNEQLFLADTYLNYLVSVRKRTEIQNTYSKGEKTVEQAANIVGLSLPKTFDREPLPLTRTPSSD